MLLRGYHGNDKNCGQTFFQIKMSGRINEQVLKVWASQSTLSCFQYYWKISLWWHTSFLLVSLRANGISVVWYWVSRLALHLYAVLHIWLHDGPSITIYTIFKRTKCSQNRAAPQINKLFHSNAIKFWKLIYLSNNTEFFLCFRQ